MRGRVEVHGGSKGSVDAIEFNEHCERQKGHIASFVATCREPGAISRGRRDGTVTAP